MVRASTRAVKPTKAWSIFAKDRSSVNPIRAVALVEFPRHLQTVLAVHRMPSESLPFVVALHVVWILCRAVVVHIALV